MNREKSIKQLTYHKNKAISSLDSYISSLINKPQPSVKNKADKLCYWITDYTRLLKKEDTFDPTKSIKYHRGDIVKVHLGYKIGNKEGGLHFGVVLNNDNPKRSGTLTIIPLTSVKENKAVHPSSILLDAELFRLIMSKHDRLSLYVAQELQQIQKKIKDIEYNKVEEYPLSLDREEDDTLNARCQALMTKQRELVDIRNSILKMKNGSIALVNQITTVSKIRIYDPVYSKSVLYGISLSDASLDLIVAKLKELYTKR